MSRPLIIGIDPGTTTAVSLLDLDGNIVSLESRKNFSREEITRHIVEYGEPVIIASDIFPTPRIVEKVAAGFLAKTVSPRQRLSRREKADLAKAYRTKTNGTAHWRNRHEKDALVAALYAWNTVRPLMRKINKKVRPPELNQLVKRHVLLSGHNIDKTVKLLNGSS